MELQKIPLNGVRVGTVDVGGPYTQTSGPSRASLEKVFTCGHLDGHHTPLCTRKIVTDLMQQAFVVPPHRCPRHAPNGADNCGDRQGCKDRAAG